MYSCRDKFSHDIIIYLAIFHYNFVETFAMPPHPFSMTIIFIYYSAKLTNCQLEIRGFLLKDFIIQGSTLIRFYSCQIWKCTVTVNHVVMNIRRNNSHENNLNIEHLYPVIQSVN